MEWKYEILPSFTATILKHSFNEENAAVGIPDFVQKYKADFALYVPMQVGICFTPETEYDWVYALGALGTLPCPDGFEHIRFPTQGWAIFFGKNSQEIRNYIYTEWFLNSGYEMLPGETLEFYDEDTNIIEIRIPAKKLS